MIIIRRYIEIEPALRYLAVTVTGNLGEPVLLHVWISVPRIHHPHYLLLTNLHRHGLLPAVWRGEWIGVLAGSCFNRKPLRKVVVKPLMFG